jgi:hypothetical protein
VEEFVMRNRLVIFVIAILVSVAPGCIAWGQSQPASGSSSSGSATGSSSASSPAQSGGQQSMQGMDMSGSHHDMSNMKDMNMGDSDKDAESETAAPVMHSMEGHMDMGPHMKMTALRKPQPGDAERAQKVADAARKVAEKYVDYHTALADGFKIFLPNVPQKIYHFTNRSYGLESFFQFNPDHPTSLLYEKHGDDYKLVGVMYTASKRMTEDELDQRIPLSVAQWHEHVDFCRAPASMPISERMQKSLGPNAEFGFKGSIHTQEACDAAGGRFLPVVFDWMVHVYPFEKDQAAVWSVERQHGDAD